MLAAVAVGQSGSQSLAEPGALRNDRCECRGEPATAVVQPGEVWIGTHERDVIVVLGNGAEV
ncbi:MAG: hypothetical protein ABS36_00255 [Acidobacteria bacterium SCN 69-37]|nr:MAG: hypothetical protein ABS36_00255 [Acidobacteria bacterium SCN 69-37]